MRNPYFQFKQFLLQHSDQGLKTTTEACIFGAWVRVYPTEQRLLDIGSGTGILSLMVAQRCEAYIDAVEINAEMYELTQQNFSTSPWNNRLKVFQTPIQQFNPEKKYDLIFSNPPFFKNHLVGSSKVKNTALHESELSQEELLKVVINLLSDHGRFAVMYPPWEAGKLASLFEANGFQCNEQLAFKDTPDKPLLRTIQVFSRYKAIKKEETLIIKNKAGLYTPEFRKLLSRYYLDL